MNDEEFAKFVTDALEKADKAASRKVFYMKTSTLKKLKQISFCVENTSIKLEESFDRATNAVDIIMTDFVFDSVTEDIKRIFNLVDVIVIDALDDGTVCIEMRILNACNVIGEV